MGHRLTPFEEGLAEVIADYVAKQKFFQTEKWFVLSCHFCRNENNTANVSELFVDRATQ